MTLLIPNSDNNNPITLYRTGKGRRHPRGRRGHRFVHGGRVFYVLRAHSDCEQRTVESLLTAGTHSHSQPHSVIVG